MKSKQTIKALVHKALALGGFHAFMFTLGLEHPLVIVTITIMTAVLLVRIILKKSYMHLLFPLAAGLLIFPMKFFYWDKTDYLHRVANLLVLALLFSLAFTIKRYRLIKRFLFFFNRLTLKKRLTAIFICAEILFIAASFLLIQNGVRLGGDEPHYLVISHSIAKDGDLNVFNQYARDEYREFVDIRLQHHARVGKGFKVWYSYGHLPGLSLTLAPFFLVKLPNLLLYFLVRAYLGLFGALMAVLAYLFALKLWKHQSLALFITAAYTFTAPVFFYAIHIFAELQAALLILSALYLLLYAQKPKSQHLRTLLAGFLLGISVFWGMKYAIFIFLFSAGFFVFYVIKKQPKRAILFVLFPVLLQILFFGYLYYAYGNFDPMSIYNGVMTPEQEQAYRSGLQHIPMQKRIETFLGIFFDQRDGLLLYSPFYFFAFPGLILALIKFKRYWPHLLISGAGFAFILFLGYSTVRAGYCPQARYLAPAAWLMMLFTIIYYKETANKLFKKVLLYLPVYGFLVTIYQVIYPFTLYQSVTHLNLNRPGLMFQQWSNIHINLADLLPSFVKVPGNFKYLPNLVFLALLAAFIWLALKPVRGIRTRRANTAMWAGMFGLLFVMFALFPKVPDYNPILLTKEGVMPCKIYGHSAYPTRANERKFELKNDDFYSFTVSTFKPADSFILELENNGEAEFSVSVTNFDRPAATAPVNASSVQKIEVAKPRYKAFKNFYYYRFHIRLTPAPPSAPSLYLQVYPGS
jgi:hypothetical protein